MTNVLHNVQSFPLNYASIIQSSFSEDSGNVGIPCIVRSEVAVAQEVELSAVKQGSSILGQ